MKILVTGATGFVGSHLCDSLAAKGHEVYAQARNKKKFELFKVPGTLVHGKLKGKVQNQWIDELPEDLDAVVHTAGLTHSLDKKRFYKVNAKTTRQLIKDLKSKYDDLKFVLISSLAVSGPTSKNNPVVETDAPRPVSHYGNSKYQAEIALSEQAPEKWEKTIIRPPMVIGPRDSAFLEVFKMVRNGLMAYPGKGGGKKQYTFISVFDLVELITRALEKEVSSPTPEIYLGGHPRNIEYRDITNTIKRLMGKGSVVTVSIPLPIIITIAYLLKLIKMIYPKFDAQLTPDKISEIAPEAWICDASKSQNQLNLSYKWDLKSTLESTYQDYKDRGWIK